MNDRRTIAGVSAVILGLMLVLGQSFGHGTIPRVQAVGDSVPTSTPEFSPTPESTVTCVIGQNCPATSTPVPTDTPGRLKTHTPTATSTSEPTEPPATPAATNTPAPRPTQPGAGTEGVAVRPPNTGSGPSASGFDAMPWAAGLGALLIALGSGAALIGFKRRR